MAPHEVQIRPELESDAGVGMEAIHFGGNLHMPCEPSDTERCRARCTMAPDGHGYI